MTENQSENQSENQEVYSHGHHQSVVNAHATRTAADCAAYLLPHLRPGLRVLDVGCGPGTITADLAELVAGEHGDHRDHGDDDSGRAGDDSGRAGDGGWVIGLDRAPEVIVQAQELAASRGIRNVTFQTGNVYDLDFPDDTFDVVHAHQVLQHLTDPVAALHELYRVTKPGGLVAVRDGDFHGMFWYPQLPELDEWMDTYQQLARSNRAEPDAGRHLISWAQSAGFTDVTPSSSNWLYATEEQRRWHAGVWAERVLHSAYAEQSLERGFADREKLQRISAGWRRWAEAPDGWFLIPCGEILARKS